jgi:hypothetical protein
MRSSRTSIFAAIVVAVFLSSTWANCLGPDSSDMQQMACCAVGHERCPMHDSAAACCTAASAGQPQATMVKAAAVSAPTLRVVAAVAAYVPLGSTRQSHPAANSSPPDAFAQPPPYIAFSSLLI